MSEWIDKLSQQIEDAENRQRHVREILPIKAAEFWNGLVSLLEQDVSKINEKFKHRIGEVEIYYDQSGLVKIRKLQYPAYYIDLTFLRQVPTIKVEVTIVNDVQKEKKNPSYNINFALDQTYNLVVSSPSTTYLKLSSISENLLSGLAQNRPAQ